MYAAMPADEMVLLNQLGVPNTIVLEACAPPPLRRVLTVAVEPDTLAVLNQLVGTVAEYRLVHAAPLGPRSPNEVTLSWEGTPDRLALMVSAGLETSEYPTSS
jgi:hypothetical protein